MQNFYDRVEKYKRLKPLLFMLCVALFNIWNKCRFTMFFSLSRDVLMNSSRMGNKNQTELHKVHFPTVTVIRLTGNEVAKSQLNLFPKGSTSAGTGVVPVVNEVVPVVLKTDTNSGTGVVPEVVHLKKQHSKQCKTNECETHAQKYPIKKKILAWFDKRTRKRRNILFYHYSANSG